MEAWDDIANEMECICKNFCSKEKIVQDINWMRLVFPWINPEYDVSLEEHLSEKEIKTAPFALMVISSKS